MTVNPLAGLIMTGYSFVPSVQPWDNSVETTLWLQRASESLDWMSQQPSYGPGYTPRGDSTALAIPGQDTHDVMPYIETMTNNWEEAQSVHTVIGVITGLFQVMIDGLLYARNGRSRGRATQSVRM